MSTKCSIAGVDLSLDVGGETFHSNIHLYTECFDESPAPVYLDIYQQGVWSNPSMCIRIPLDKVLELADQLTKWAANVRRAKEKES